MPRINARDKNEQEVLIAIEQWLSTHSYGPSFRDLVKATGLSLGTVHNACRDLRDKKTISYLDGVARTIRILEHTNTVE